jgi:pheromone shutdown-related protein TraB
VPRAAGPSRGAPVSCAVTSEDAIDTPSAESLAPPSPEAASPEPAPDEGSDVHVVEQGGRTFILIGTAHVSQESADLVREVIERERPDGVCIELDEARFEALSHPERFEALDLKQVLRTRQLATLALNLLLAAYQKSLGLTLGVKPGTELLEGARVAEEHGIPIHLCDRDVRITLRRAWRALSLWKKSLLLSSLLGGAFTSQEISEEDLRELRRSDVLSGLLQELGEAFPGLKRVLIDERDGYLAECIRQSEGQRLVAVVGAGHIAGIKRLLSAETPVDLEPLAELPPPSNTFKIMGWGIPALVIAGLVAIGLQQGADAARESLVFWILVNGIPAAIGTTIALGHPLTILTAFVSAPITSLTPVIGVGYLAAFVQAWLRPPFVRELGTVLDDLTTRSGLWRNRLLRILFVFALSTVGSLIGTFSGGTEIFLTLFGGASGG